MFSASLPGDSHSVYTKLLAVLSNARCMRGRENVQACSIISFDVLVFSLFSLVPHQPLSPHVTKVKCRLRTLTGSGEEERAARAVPGSVGLSMINHCPCSMLMRYLKNVIQLLFILHRSFSVWLRVYAGKCASHRLGLFVETLSTNRVCFVI